MITGAAQMDGAILVVSATHGLTQQTREQIRIAARVNVPALFVYLNDVDPTRNEVQLDGIESELKRLTSVAGFQDIEVPMIRGSALAALEGRDEAIGDVPIRELMRELDEKIPEQIHPRDQPFLMAIEDVFSISGQGATATGRIEQGLVKAGDEIEIVGLSKTLKRVCGGVMMFRKSLDQGEPGDNVGIVLEDTKRDEIERGQVLCAPGSITPHTRFEAEAFFLTEKEGGRHSPVPANYRAQFYFRTTDVSGDVELLNGTLTVSPGDTCGMNVQLVAPIAMQEGQRFAIREGGRTVGAGVIVAIFE